MAEIEKINTAAEIAKLKRGSFLGDMYKVREIMIQRRKDKAEQEEREKAALAKGETIDSSSKSSDPFQQIAASFGKGSEANGSEAEGQPTVASSVDQIVSNSNDTNPDGVIEGSNVKS